MDFKPCYTWPNPAFPFRLYFNHEHCRIFIIENISHNWNWLYQFRDRIRPTDYFFVQLGWYFDDWLALESKRAIDALELDASRFVIMYADYASKQTFEGLGFRGCIVNHNCFLDYNQFTSHDEAKEYDAIYVARFSPGKRHYLCDHLCNLALVAGNAWGVEAKTIPPHSFKNELPLTPNQVIEKINQSKCGLALSEFEGACYSSSEYLLCGIPVVSTWSHGGRDIWYNSYNSIICDADPSKVAQAVTSLISRKRDPSKIRDMHIRLSEQMRDSFKEYVSQIIRQHNVSIDIDRYFEDNYFHKMIKSQRPDFSQLF